MKTTHNAMKRLSDRGFSLFELMLLMMVMALILSMGIPQLRYSVAAYRLVSCANMVAGELSAGRTMAISRSTVHEVTLDTINHTIQITDPDDADNAPRIMKFLDSGITFALVPDPTISFFGRGLARGGTIVLENEFGDPTSITVTAGGKVTIG